MKIRTQFILTLSLFGLILIGMIGSLIVTNQEVDRLYQQEEIARQIEKGASELNYLWGDYLMYGESQQRARWESRFASFYEDVSKLDPANPQQQTIVAHIKSDQKHLQEIFRNVVSTREESSEISGAAPGQTFTQVSWSRMEVQNQSIAFEASLLSRQLRDEADRLKQLNIMLMFMLFGIFGAYLLVNHYLIDQRTLRSIAKLQAGTEIIGAGNLDFNIAVKRVDEIGELSRAFNRMTVSLKEVTASKTDLEREIAEREQVEEALRESEQRYSTIFDTSPFAMSLSKMPENVIVGVNNAFIKLFEFTPEKVIGRTSVDLGIADPESRAQIAAEMRAHGSVQNFEVTRMTKTGVRRILSLNLNVVSISGGEHILTTIRDVTERRQAEEQIARINEKLNEILGSIRDDFYVLDHDWNFVYASRLFTSKVGKEPEDFVGNNIWKMFPKHVGTTLEENFRAAMEKRETRRFEIGGKYTHAWYRMSVFPSADGIAVLGTDITERRRAEEALRESEERFRLALSHAPVAVAIQDRDLRYTWAYNQKTRQVDEILGKTDMELFPLEAAHLTELKRRALETGENLSEKLWVTSNNQRLFLDLFISPLKNEMGEIDSLGLATVDLTQIKLTQEALQEVNERLEEQAAELEMQAKDLQSARLAALNLMDDALSAQEKVQQINLQLFESEQRLNRAQEMAHLGSWELDLIHNQLTWSDEVYRIFGLQPQEFSATYEAFIGAVHPDDRAEVNEAYTSSIQEGRDSYEIEHQVVKHSTGEVRIVHEKCDHFRNDEGLIVRSIGMVHDITDRKQAEDALQKSEAMLRAVLDQMPSGVTVRDASTGELILSNPRSQEIMGALVDTTDQFVEYRGLHPGGSPYRTEEWPIFRSIATGEIVDAEEMEFERSPGARTTISISSAPIRDVQGRIVSSVAVFHDITERRRTEERLHQLNRTLRALSNTNQVMIRATSERQYLDDVCKIVVEDCGHSMVWIGFARDDKEKSVQPVASAGFEEGYLETLNISWADNERGRGPTGTAIRTGKSSRCNNILIDPHFAPWREAAIKRGYSSSIVLPLSAEGKAFGALNIYSHEPDIFSEQEEALLTELAGDLAYGILSIRIREAHDLMEAELRRAHDKLEMRVRERTEELAAANRELSNEIAERREIERQLRIQTAAMDSAANGIIITDTNGCILWTNPAVTQISGYARHELIGQSTRLFNSGRQDSDFYHQMWETILAGNVWQGETINRRKDGGQYVEEQTITPVRDENGQVSHFIAVKQDVTERKLIYSQLEDSNRELMTLTTSEREQRILAEGLVESSVVLNMSLELHAVLDHIIEQTSRTIPYLVADIVLIDENVANVVRQWDFQTHSNRKTIVKNDKLNLHEFPTWEKICSTKSVVMIADTRRESQWNTYFGMTWVRSYLGAPLIYSDRVIGIINLISDQAGAFHAGMVKTLAAFAAPAAVAIQNARLYEDEQQNRKIAEILSAASVALAQTLDIQMVMETILDYVQFVMPFDVALVVMSEGDERYKIRAVRTSDENALLRDSLQDQTIDMLSQPIIRSYLTKYQSTSIPDSREIPNWDPPAELTSLNCWFGIPLESMGKILGIVVVAHATPHSFTSQQIQLVEAVVKQAVVALQNAWLFEQVRSGRERLQQLSRHLVEIQENERKYIARELHDETSQSLTSLKLGLQVIEQKAAGHEQLMEQVIKLKGLADETLESLHHLAVNLRPASLDHLGLVDALTGLIESTRQRSGLSVHFKIMGPTQAVSLTEEMETSIYRIVQESITNVLRHAHATYVDVILEWQEDRIVVIIEDDGVGIDMQKASERGRLGMIGMQERAEMFGGKLLVDSTPQVGTTLVVEIPYVN